MAKVLWEKLLANWKKPMPVVAGDEFCFAAVALDHNHIDGMCAGLVGAGATLKSVYDADRAKAEAFAARYPGAAVVDSVESVLEDGAIRLVCGAAIPSQRCALGLKVMGAGKDYFCDKAPFTTLDQLRAARLKADETGRKYMVYYSERLHSECSVFAGELIASGAIGTVINVMGLGPHRLNAQTRPEWFFRKETYGGILCDIGSHQIEQYLYFANEVDAEVARSNVANHDHPEYPELEDFGEAMLVGKNGSTNYFRVDWFTPDGLSNWGDGRTILLGTEGYIELRKYLNVGTGEAGDLLFLVDGKGEAKIDVKGKIGYPFFGQLILDCLNRTENAMTQRHAFKAAELCLKAQAAAVKVR